MGKNGEEIRYDFSFWDAVMGKGSQYERDICRELSLWWTGGKSDSCFWRTSNSGGRATVRKKVNKKTDGHYGDIGAVDRVGEILIDVLTIEIKRGYSKHSIGDIFDVSDSAAEQVFEKFFSQTIRAHENAGSFAWALISKRDRRDAIIVVPKFFWEMVKHKNMYPRVFPHFTMQFQRNRKDLSRLHGIEIAVGMRLSYFLKMVTPAAIKELSLK